MRRILLATLFIIGFQPVAATDPLLGKWLGEASTEQETVVFGLEFTSTPDGDLGAAVTLPVTNYYGLPLPGSVQREGQAVQLPGLGLRLELRGEVLSGRRDGKDGSVAYTLRRNAELPAAPTPPALPEGPDASWRTRLNGQIWASPVASQGRVFIGSSGGVMNALDGSDGRLLWSRALGAPVFGAAAVSGDAVFVASDGGRLHRLAVGDGSETWSYELGDAHVPRVLPHPTVFDWEWQAATPLVAGDGIYLGAADGGFHAVDRDSGERRWRFESGAAVRNGAAASADRIVFGNAKGWLFALDQISGRELWRVDTGAKVDTTPLMVGDAVVVGTRGSGLLAYALEDGALRWRSPFWGSWVESSPVLHEGVLYIGGSDIRRISAIDPSNGKVLWRSDVFGWSFGTPLLVGDTLHVGAAGGAPYFVPHFASYSVLDRASGRLLRRRPLADDGGHQWGIVGSPVRVGDTVVVATLAGSVLGFPIE